MGSLLWHELLHSKPLTCARGSILVPATSGKLKPLGRIPTESMDITSQCFVLHFFLQEGLASQSSTLAHLPNTHAGPSADVQCAPRKIWPKYPFSGWVFYHPGILCRLIMFFLFLSFLKLFLQGFFVSIIYCYCNGEVSFQAHTWIIEL